MVRKGAMTVRLIHWKAAEAAERAARLETGGYAVTADPLTPAGLRDLKANPPAAVVIDLSRLPSQGRDLGMMLRKAKATRYVPLVFVDGEPGKVERVRRQLPDAVYTTWSRIRSGLKQALGSPPRDPIVPGSVMDSYRGVPLVRKLGIKPGLVVSLVGAPRGFEQTLGDLPDGASVRRQRRAGADLVLWFVRSLRDLETGIGKMPEFFGKEGLWICWPKQASGLATDLTQNAVRRVGLASGLVDFKVSSIDSTWSGLKFTRRKGCK